MKTIGMVVAMQKEIVPFLCAQNVEITEETHRGFLVMKFKLGDNNIVCVRSGIGEIFASAATQMLIGEYGADTIINFGVCGALTDKFALNSVVLVKGVAHYDFDISAIDNCAVGKYPDQPSVIIPTDEELRAKALKIMPGLKEVVCASADKFVSDELIKERLHSTYGADICEMESAGVLLTSKNAGVPCLIVKAVSDGKGGAEEYKQMVNSASGKYVGLICELCEK